MSEELRIGHRGLEHREHDDTYWLNGTNIDDLVYNQELQRIIAHQQVSDEAKLIRELQQAQDLQNTQLRRAQTERDTAGNSKLMNVVYGYAPTYREFPNIPPKVHEAMSLLELQNAKAQSTPKPAPMLSLKTTPLFPHLRWRFDSPFNPLRRRFIRWAWEFQRRQARAA